MSRLESSRTAGGSAGGDAPAPWRALALLVGIFLAEVLAATLAFDGRTARRGGLLGGLLAGSGLIGRAALAAAASVVLLGGRRIGRALASEGGGLRLSRPLLTAHLLAYVAFLAMARRLFDGAATASVSADLEILAWSGLGLASASLLLASLAPPRAWLSIARRNIGTLAVAAAIGVGSVAVAMPASWLWRPVGRSTMAGAAGLLGLWRGDLVYRPAESVVGTRSFLVEIGAPCSGFEGMGLILVFLGAYLASRRSELRLPRALLLLPLGVALAWALNVVRIVSLIEVGARLSPRIALGGFHSQAGWLAFIAVALGLAALGRGAPFRRADGDLAPESGGAEVVAYLAPLAALLAASMIARAFSDRFDALYPIRVVAIAAALVFCRRGRAERLWSWSWWGFAAGVVALLPWLVLESYRPAPPSDGPSLGAALRELPPITAAIWLAFRVAGSVVAVPMAEELAFRGYLLRRLSARDFLAVTPARVTWVAVVVSSLLFGALHGRWLAGTLAGLIYAAAFLRRGRLGDAVLAHATTNALIAALVLTRGSWSLWE
jgi:exosortase E/protease (VPEID-CTERM system)